MAKPHGINGTGKMKYTWEIKDFYEKNKSYCIAFLIVVVIVFAGIWLVCDYNRNKPVYNSTDSTVADLEKRINSIESRIDGLSARLEKAQETVNSIGRRVDTSTGLAREIESGVGSIETRLDSAVERSKRIENLIDEIERANR